MVFTLFIIFGQGKMKKFFCISVLVFAVLGGQAQYMTHSIEHEFHCVGVFNPEWEQEHVLNPAKYEHLTGYFREKLAEVILSAVKQKRVRIYDERKREMNLDTLMRRISDFEFAFSGRRIGVDTLFEYITPFVSAYQFEEFVNYNYEDLSMEKRVKAYCPHVIRYKAFNGEPDDTVRMPLFWIFPSDSTSGGLVSLHDTVLSVHELRYPAQMPFASSLFELVKQKKLKVYRPDGSEFSTPKQVDDLFVLKNTYTYYDETTGGESLRTGYSDIMPEDIIAIRIGENWVIDPKTLNIKKEIFFFLPLYRYDDERFGQLGLRVYNKNHRAR